MARRTHWSGLATRNTGGAEIISISNAMLYYIYMEYELGWADLPKEQALELSLESV